MLEWEHVPEKPPVEQPRRTGKKRCYGHKSEGQYVAVFVRSPTHLLRSKTFSNPLEPFQIKKYIFLKTCVRSSLLCWICFCMYMCVYSIHGYATFFSKTAYLTNAKDVSTDLLFTH